MDFFVVYGLNEGIKISIEFESPEETRGKQQGGTGIVIDGQAALGEAGIIDAVSPGRNA